MADDFGAITKLPVSETKQKKDTGEKRSWLKVFETLPPQMLNAYGPAKYAKLSDEEVWKNMCMPLKSGAVYMTELCDSTAERRGVGINRWLHAMKLFCEYQMEPSVKRQNEALIEATKCKELYDEIKEILPSLVYCLAPKKMVQRAGASSLRSSAIEQERVDPPAKTEELLDHHAQILYEWLDVEKTSRVRMLVHWHSAAGLSYVAAVHHRGMQCFRHHGNAHHDTGATAVTLSEFQEGIKVRHALGSRGMEEAAGASSGSTARDFA